MYRIITISLALLGIGLMALAAQRLQQDPYALRRAEIDTRAAAIQPEEITINLDRRTDLSQMRAKITANGGLWKELIEPPPPPPPPKAKAPDIDKALEGIVPTRQSIGSAVLFRVPGNNRARVSVGDVLNGCTVAEVTRTDVLFELPWAGGVVKKRIPRQ